MAKVEAYLGVGNRQVILCIEENKHSRLTFLNEEEVDRLIGQLKYAKEEIWQ